MDPVCEEKINFLQKYVPFLANLIGLLANDSEKEGKLAQMQLLYDLLCKPDKSVKIETLEKCEEVLSRVFGNADANDDIRSRRVSAECMQISESILVKTEIPEEDEDEEEQMQEEEMDKRSTNVNGIAEKLLDSGEGPQSKDPPKELLNEAATSSKVSPEKLEGEGIDKVDICNETASNTEVSTTHDSEEEIENPKVDPSDESTKETVTGEVDEESEQTEECTEEIVPNNAETAPENLNIQDNLAEEAAKVIEEKGKRTERNPEISATAPDDVCKTVDPPIKESEDLSMEATVEPIATAKSNLKNVEKEVDTDAEPNTNIESPDTDKSQTGDGAEEGDDTPVKSLPTEVTASRLTTLENQTETEINDGEAELSSEGQTQNDPKTLCSNPSETHLDEDTAIVLSMENTKKPCEETNDAKTDCSNPDGKAHADNTATVLSEESTKDQSREADESKADCSNPDEKALADDTATTLSEGGNKKQEAPPENNLVALEGNSNEQTTDLITNDEKALADDQATVLSEENTKELTEKTDNAKADCSNPDEKALADDTATTLSEEGTKKQEAPSENNLVALEGNSNEQTTDLITNEDSTPKESLVVQSKESNKSEKPGLDPVQVQETNLKTTTESTANQNESLIVPDKTSENSSETTQDAIEISQTSESASIPNNTENTAALKTQISPETPAETSESLPPEATQKDNPEPDEENNIITQSETDTFAFKIISAESLAIQSVVSLNDEEEQSLLKPLGEENGSDTPPNDQLDPLLAPPEDLLQEPSKEESKSKERTTAEKDDGDDDDVLLVENRSSPICLDSDPEDEENAKLNRSLLSQLVKPTVTTPKPQQKATMRKPLPSAENLRNMIKNHNISIRKTSASHKRPRGFVKKDPKALMETINLLDSDSDDGKPTNQADDDDVIIVSSTQPQRKVMRTNKPQTATTPRNASRLPQKMPNKSPAKTPTAQSNFLNAVNLQPTPKSSSNPASFSAQLSNKKVIIPNAFYGNPSYNRKTSSSSSVVVVNNDESSSNDSMSRSSAAPISGIQQLEDNILKDWLEGFLTNFASPLQLASHACFVLLQRVLKYRFFQRLKEIRVNLNTLAKSSVPESMDVQLLLDLRNVFLENGRLTDAGRKFCRFATNDAFGKPVALTTDSRTNRVTCRTRISSSVVPHTVTSNPSPVNNNSKEVKFIPLKPNITTPVVTPNPSSILPKSLTATPDSTPSVSASTPVSHTPRRGRKARKLSDGADDLDFDADDNDYTPSTGELVPEQEVVTERKRSLRTNRTKRKEAGFTYSEDHDDEEFEALAKKIEDKKREELRLAEERELEWEKEKERKVKKTVAKKTTSKRQSNSDVAGHMDDHREPTRKKLRLVDTEILGNANDDLLTPTWVEAEGDDEADSLLDFADDPQSPDGNSNENNLDEAANSGGPDSDNSDSNSSRFDVGTKATLLNTDRTLHAHSESFDFCVHCLKRIPRTIHHYVNEHRSSEVFPSRLRTKDIRRLLTTSNVGFVHLYKGNQTQYAAHCIFCDKEAKFLLPYWFEHFTMHTGEYSFKCSGCKILKPTRSLLTNHLQSGAGCPKKGAAVKLTNFDTKSHKIEGYICTLCNYIQVHKHNVERHLRTQHGLETITKQHIITVILLQISGPYRDQQSVDMDESQLSLLQHSDGEDNGLNGTFDENSLMLQNDFTDNDDLSFMICGMLDVQTNLSVPGEVLGNVDTTNSVDNQ